MSVYVPTFFYLSLFYAMHFLFWEGGKEGMK
jgi:hypothetical protein